MKKRAKGKGAKEQLCKEQRNKVAKMQRAKEQSG